ncbi:major facilitator superfamily domain-containing protein [Cladochytrium replicatum]|nr:major facilitator superfamily domain-containing protein [Cladochytrium replicatum]
MATTDSHQHVIEPTTDPTQSIHYVPAKTDEDEGNVTPYDANAEPRVKLSRSEFTFLYIGLVLAVLLAALDQTIVSTAIPTIVTEFKAADLISWIGTGYLLTSASFAPIYGKLADTFGRKWVFLATIFVFELGSLICGLATSIEMLIAGRVVSGIGGGGIFSLVFIIISDIVSLQDRGKYQGFVGAVFGLSSVIGPLIGGAFTDSSATWRWAFYINLPIGGFTILVVLIFLRLPHTDSGESIATKIQNIDYLGVLILVGAVTSLLLPLQLGGTSWAWDAPQTIVLFVACAVLLAAFLWVESKFSKEPIVPMSVFSSMSVYASLIMPIFTGAAFLATNYYIPLYFQVVQNDNATVSGLKTIPTVAGVVFCSIASGIIVSKTGRITPFFYAGGILLTIGAGLLCVISEFTEYWKIAIILFVVGAGVGLLIQTMLLGAQAVVHPSKIAIATSLSGFSQTIGGAIGIAIFGVIFSNRIYSELLLTLPPAYADPVFVKTLSNAPNAVRSILAALPNNAGADLFPIYLAAFVSAMRYAFYAAIPISGMILVCALFIRIPIIGLKQAKRAAGDSETGKSVVGTEVEVESSAEDTVHDEEVKGK